MRDPLPRKEPSQDEKTQPVTVRLPESWVRELDAIAAQSGYRRSDVLRHFVRYAVDAHRASGRRGKKDLK